MRFVNPSNSSNEKYVKVDFDYVTKLMARKVIFKHDKDKGVSLTLEDRKFKGDRILDKRVNEFNFVVEHFVGPSGVELVLPSSPKQVFMFDLVKNVSFNFERLPNYTEMNEAIGYFGVVLRYIDMYKDDSEGIPYRKI